MPVRHYLRANERSGAPQRYVCFDVETTPRLPPDGQGPTVNVFRCGVGIKWKIRNGRAAGVQVRRFTERESMLAWLHAQGEAKARTYLFAHWLGYDLTALKWWDALERGQFKPYQRTPTSDACMVVDDPPTILDVVAGEGRRQTYLDLMQYMPKSLAAIGEMLGCPKWHRPGDEASDNDVLDYCEQDARIVMLAVTRLVQLVKTADLGNFRYTLSGQSQALWQHLRPTPDVLLGHDDELKKMERRAYYGMGVTNYYIGEVRSPATFFDVEDGTADTPRGCERTGPVYKLDVNSCYPYLMHRHAFPVSYCYSLTRPSVRDLADRMACMEGVADVQIRSDIHVYPVRREGETVWANGAFPTTLCGPELRQALDNGEVVEVISAQLYVRGRPFVAFAERCWRLKDLYARQGKRWEEALIKRLSKSLHGKLGQRGERWETVNGICPPVEWGRWPEWDEESQEWVQWRSLGGNCQTRSLRSETSTNFPLIAAYVCAYARCYLRALIDTAGPRGVYYWDADCIHTSSAGYARISAAGLIDPRSPGLLKLVSQSTGAEYRGPKNYRLGADWTRAGVGSKAVVTESGMVWEEAVYGLGSALARTPPDGPVSQQLAYREPVGRVRGHVARDGWVKPLREVYA